MNPEEAGQKAAAFWEAVVDVAQTDNLSATITQIARAGKVSEKGVARRISGVRFFLKRGVTPEKLKEMGQEYTLRRLAEEKRKDRGEGKAAKRFCLEVPEDLHGSLCAHRERMGKMGIDMAEYFNAHLVGLTDVELYHAAGLSK